MKNTREPATITGVEISLLSANLALNSVADNFKELTDTTNRVVKELTSKLDALKGAITQGYDKTRASNNTHLSKIATSLKSAQELNKGLKFVICGQMPTVKDYDYTKLIDPSVTDDGFIVSLKELCKLDYIARLKHLTILADKLTASKDALYKEAKETSDEFRSRKEALGKSHTILHNRLLMVIDKFFRTRLELYKIILSSTQIFATNNPHEDVRTSSLRFDADSIIEESQNHGRKMRW